MEDAEPPEIRVVLGALRDSRSAPLQLPSTNKAILKVAAWF